MRRATNAAIITHQPVYISIHALHEESDRGNQIVVLARLCISIHALHEESDSRRWWRIVPCFAFQSTLSMRRATPWFRGTCSEKPISIHALHEESDHTPYQHGANKCTFQSTLSMRRATRRSRRYGLGLLFQSTLSMRRATCMAQQRHVWLTYFNPRSP